MCTDMSQCHMVRALGVAYIVMACVVLAYSYGLCSYGLVMDRAQGAQCHAKKSGFTNTL